MGCGWKESTAKNQSPFNLVAILCEQLHSKPAKNLTGYNFLLDHIVLLSWIQCCTQQSMHTSVHRVLDRTLSVDSRTSYLPERKEAFNWVESERSGLSSKIEGADGDISLTDGDWLRIATFVRGGCSEAGQDLWGTTVWTLHCLYPALIALWVSKRR